ncbi:MAG: WbqC family protein [Candidatus Omnitrophica bacterium]|nr:WbqC family protein [Candidatus Omnitrophota bacterium]
MIVTIHQPQYLPWLGYFDKADRADTFILLDDVQFKKNEWQNRNKICTSQGWQWLTVPVLHDFGQKINEVKINNKVDWRKSHLRAIELNYSRAPFYDQYIEVFQTAYQRSWEYLAQINVYFIERIIELLGVKTKIVLSSEYNASQNPTQRLIDLCKQFDAQIYLSGKDGSKYMDFSEFEASRIKIRVQDFKHPKYRQQWPAKEGDFISHLSVIDLLFNYGPESLKIIRSTKENI